MTALFRQSRSPVQRWLALSACVVLWWSGCASRGQLEALESELRLHEDSMRQAAAKSQQLESQLAEARRETELLRSQLTASGSQSALPEQTGSLVRLSGVKVNTLLSGGKDRDDQPGDDVLVMLISPHDEQGDLVKIAGEVEIEAYDMTRTGDDKRVGRWTFDPDQASRAWHSGFVGAGLQFELPWQESPTSRELVVHARLRTVDGRQFDTHTPLKVNPPTGGAPALTPVPPIQPVKHETDHMTDRQIRTADFEEVQSTPAPVRPVPMYDDVDDGNVEEDEEPRPFPGNTHPAKRVPSIDRTNEAPGRATLDGVETSDNWTDETIPRLR